MKMAIAVLALLFVVATAALVPVRPYMDFQVLFHADMGLLRGIPLYDHAGQVGDDRPARGRASRAGVRAALSLPAVVCIEHAVAGVVAN